MNTSKLRSYKTEIAPTTKQAEDIRRSIGVCRWLYNEYIARNKLLYEKYQRGELAEDEKHFISAFDFDKIVNHEIKTLPEYEWINSCGSKARKKAICNAEAAFNRFFDGTAGFPKFKKKNRQDVKIYFPKNSKGDWTIERHWVQIPTIGHVKLKEFGYLPTNAKVKSGTVSYKAGRYYVSVCVEITEPKHKTATGIPLGIDLGVKTFAVLSDGTKYRNVNKSLRVRKLKKKLRREQRRLSRKYESKKKRGEKTATNSANIAKSVLKVQKLHQRLDFIRDDFINKTISEIVQREPSYITLEDLNVKGMMKNRHLARAIAESKFYEFRAKLTVKCQVHGIELRIADRFEPSSKMCHECGYIKKDLKLSERIYECPQCGKRIDRDLNAALNLRDVTKYKTA